jgi:phage terminase small subunit
MTSLANQIPEPPAPLDPIAVAAWHRIVPQLIGRGLWDELYDSSVAVMCGSFSLYIRLREAAATLEGNPSTRAGLLAEAERSRKICRSLTCDFFLIPADRLHLVELDSAGRDVELDRLFGRAAAETEG